MEIRYNINLLRNSVAYLLDCGYKELINAIESIPIKVPNDFEYGSVLVNMKEQLQVSKDNIHDIKKTVLGMALFFEKCENDNKEIFLLLGSRIDELYIPDTGGDKAALSKAVVSDLHYYGEGIGRRNLSKSEQAEMNEYIDLYKRTPGEVVVDVAKKIHEDQIDWVYHTEHPLGGASLWYYDIERSLSNNYKTVCCATYVSIVLYKAGYFDEKEINSFNYNYQVKLDQELEKKGWERITEEEQLQAGDIVFMDYKTYNSEIDHVQIYAGDNKWFNAGNTQSIQTPEAYEDTNWKKDVKKWHAYRPPELDNKDIQLEKTEEQEISIEKLM